ncbi:hypothetical protein EON68_04130 [archaeon]|nr:MAG: hypothetical protein EON68_04130 [archaeon]
MLLRRLTVRRAATSSMFGGRVVVPPSPLAATTTASALRASVHALPAPATTASMHPLSASAHFSTSTLRAAPTSAAAVKALRTATGAPISECKAALDACGGVEEAAIDWLRKKGLAAAAKKAGRTAAQGIVAVAAAPSDFPAPEAACMVEVRAWPRALGHALALCTTRGMA